MLPEVCPFILETMVFVGWRKVLFHAGTKCWSYQRYCGIPVLVDWAESKQGFSTQEGTDIGGLLVCWHVGESEVLVDQEKPVAEKEEVVLPEILVWLGGSATRVSMIIVVVVFHLSCLQSCFTLLLGRYIRKLFHSFVRLSRWLLWDGVVIRRRSWGLLRSIDFVLSLPRVATCTC